MFSTRMVIIVGLIGLLLAGFVVLSVSARYRYASLRFGHDVIVYTVSPFQKVAVKTFRFAYTLWNDYFDLVDAAKDNKRLNQELKALNAEIGRLHDVEKTNIRLKKLLEFKEGFKDMPAVAAEIIGKDPSPWFNTVMIDKGRREGLKKGLAVMAPEGVVGQVTEVSYTNARVTLLVDRNAAVDALIRRTRARGIVRGDGAEGRYGMEYVLKKEDVEVGDVVISSGLDRVFPKGLKVGEVLKVEKGHAGMFQRIAVTPYVDFEKLEEVVVVMDEERVRMRGDMP